MTKTIKTPSPNQQAIDLRKKIIKLQNQESKLSIKIHDLTEEMLLVCTHPDIKKEYGYIPGDYYVKCVYTNKEVCQFCSKIFTEERQLGGYE